MEYTKDALGKELLLKDDLQVAMEWERPYLEACIDALKPTGNVLEIGFGLGYAADRIQKHNPKTHTIIENDPEALTKATEWAANYENVNVIEGRWWHALEGLSQFDAIFFDDQPLDWSEAEKIQKDIQRLQVKTQELETTQQILANQLKILEGTKFSDKDILDFQNYLTNNIEECTEEQIRLFIDGLKNNGCITDLQHTTLLSSLQDILNGISQQESWKLSPSQCIRGDKFVQFVDLCLSKHMLSGARLTSYIDYQQFQNKKEWFYDHLKENQNVKWTEKLIDVDVPNNCKYYQGNKAIIIVLEKK